MKGKKYLETKKGIHGKVCTALINSNEPTEAFIGKILLKLIPIRGAADYDWKEKDFKYFKKIFPKVQKDVENGLQSLEYLNNKFKN